MSLLHLFAVPLAGYKVSDLRNFVGKVREVMALIDPSEVAGQTQLLYNWLFEKLRGCPGLRNKVEAIRDSEPGSHLRTWNHLWRVLNDHIVVVHEDANYDNLWQHGQPRAQAVGGAPVNPKSPSKPSGYSPGGKDDKGRGKDKGSGKGKDSGKDGGKSSGKADLQAGSLIYRFIPYYNCHYFQTDL